MTSDTNSADADRTGDTATDGADPSDRLENDLDPLAKGEPSIAESPFPEAQDGGRPDGLPSARTDTSLADGGTLEEPGASDLEGTAS